MMKLALIAAILLSATCATLATPWFSQDLIDAVNNNPASTWRAKRNFFSLWEKEDIQALLGAKIKHGEDNRVFNKIQQNIPVDVLNFGADIPDSFDARKQWGSCIHPIRNQAQCGSCWAFSATEVLSDRFCIQSNGTIDVILSPQDLVSCDTTNDGCDGGMLDTAWAYMQSSGVVEDACFPYASADGNAPSCPAKCKNTGKSFASDKYYAASYKHIGDTIFTWRRPALIQQEILANGPVQAAFSVYQDFMNYESGVYQHVTGSLLGGHAIKIVGWGTDNGTPYWIVANSWGTDWGLDGFFWILRGSNECGIEADVYAGPANLNNIPSF